MKRFFASFARHLITLSAALMLLILLVIGIIAVSLTPTPLTIEDDSILVVDLTFNLVDTPEQSELEEVIREALADTEIPTVQLRELRQLLQHAANDDQINGVLLTGTILPLDVGSSWAAVRELRSALVDFTASGKPLVAWSDFPSARDYYLMSAADEFYLFADGASFVPGLASEPVFFGEALERYGIEVTLYQSSPYKSANDAFVRSELSPEAEAELQWLLDGIWTDWRDTVAAARNLTPEAIEALTHTQPLMTASEAVEAGLFDGLRYRDEIVDRMRELGEPAEDGPGFVGVDYLYYRDMLREQMRWDEADDRIAIVYAEGIVVPGEADLGELGSGPFVRTLADLRHDEDVKAVVLRINSPGGSGLAMDEMHRAVRRLVEEKPVVVSMGGLAASAGYGIAAPANHLIAQPTTITGSIGVIAMTLHVNELTNRFGVTFDRVKTAPFADMLTPTRHPTEAERERFFAFVSSIYEDFLRKVSEDRDMPLEELRPIAGGRAWTGEQALERGLIDQLGSLEDAIAKAAELAGVEQWAIDEYPQRRLLEDEIAELLGADIGARLRTAALTPDRGPLAALWHQVRADFRLAQQLRDPRGVYAILPYRLSID